MPPAPARSLPARYRHRLLGETRAAAAAGGQEPPAPRGGTAGPPSPAPSCPGRGSLGCAGFGAPGTPPFRDTGGAGSGPWRAAAVTGPGRDRRAGRKPQLPRPGPPAARGCSPVRHGAPGPCPCRAAARTVAAARARSPVLLGGGARRRTVTFSRCSGRINRL